jgi:hypothetical protein
MQKFPRLHPSPAVFLRRLRSRLARLLPFAAASLGAAALAPTEWPQRQPFPVAAPGLVKIVLPAATFDNALPGLPDLRVVGPGGQEIPYLLEQDLAAAGPGPTRPLEPASFQATATGDGTQLLLATGITSPLDALELETAAPYFLKAAHVDVSPDGVAWQSLGPAEPVFRQFGAEQLRLPLHGQRAAYVRVTLDDTPGRAVVFTSARLLPAPVRAAAPPLVSVGARIAQREEYAGESVLTVELDARNLPLAELALDVREPLFMRRVTVAVREVSGAVSTERVVGTGTLYRIALEGAPARARLELPLEFTPLTRELLVHIHNGDSPPLTLDGVDARQHPVTLLFLAPAAGAYQLLTGNPQAVAPHYDLAAFGAELGAATAAAVVPGRPEPVPDYHPRESLAEAPLPDVPLTGAPLDTKDWPERKPVLVARAGVQELELDLAILAHTRADFGDLRLLRAGNQIPYVLERPPLARSLSVDPVAAPDPKRPGVSLWQLRLPHAGGPFSRLVLTSASPLFRRQFQLYEKLTGAGGRGYANTLAAGEWSRTPEPGVPPTRIFELPDRLRTDTVWIETDNGDNPPITLGACQAVYPVVRLIFKVADTDGLTVAYGNAAAAAPHYDLSLVAVKLLTASRNIAQLGSGEPNPGASRNPLAGINGGYVFWGALGLVVVVLLVVVAKLLPKPTGGG